jgi:hypothetical protein
MARIVKWDLLEAADYYETQNEITADRIVYVDQLTDAAMDYRIREGIKKIKTVADINSHHPDPELKAQGMVVTGYRPLEILSGNQIKYRVMYGFLSEPMIDGKWWRELNGTLKMEQRSVDRTGKPIISRYVPGTWDSTDPMAPFGYIATWTPDPTFTDPVLNSYVNRKRFVKAGTVGVNKGFTVLTYRRRFSAVQANALAVQQLLSYMGCIGGQNYILREFGWTGPELLVGPIHISSRDRYRTWDVQVELWRNPFGWNPFAPYIDEMRQQMWDSQYTSDGFGLDAATNMTYPDSTLREGRKPYGITRPDMYPHCDLIGPIPNGLDLENIETGVFP